MFQGLKAGLSILFMLLIAAVTMTAATADAIVIDRIVATVNGEIITMKEVEDELAQVMKKQPADSTADMEQIRRRVLDTLITKKLVLQEGERLKIMADDDDISRMIKQIKERNNLTQAELEAKLTESGTDMETFRKQLRVDMVRTRLIEMEVRSRVVVPMEMVERYYRQQGGEPVELESGSIGLRNILFKLPADAPKTMVASVMARAEDVRKSIQRGKDFGTAAKQYSDAPNAGQGGDLGTVDPADVDRRIRAAIAGLKSGEVSRPVLTDQGVQLFQIVDRASVKKAASKKIQIPPDERERIHKMLMEKMLKEKFEEWVQQLRSRALVEVKM